MNRETTPERVTKYGRAFTFTSVNRFFNRAWTLAEAQAYYQGAKNLRPENVQLLKLIELQLQQPVDAK